RLFRIRQRNDGFGVPRESFGVVAHDAAALEEFVDADSAGEARGGVRRQTMARPRDVIAGGDGREWAEENPAGVTESLQHVLLILNLNRDMLGGETVRELDQIVERFADNDRAAILERTGDRI